MEPFPSRQAMGFDGSTAILVEPNPVHGQSTPCCSLEVFDVVAWHGEHAGHLIHDRVFTRVCVCVCSSGCGCVSVSGCACVCVFIMAGKCSQSIIASLVDSFVPLLWAFIMLPVVKWIPPFPLLFGWVSPLGSTTTIQPPVGESLPALFLLCAPLYMHPHRGSFWQTVLCEDNVVCVS